MKIPTEIDFPRMEEAILAAWDREGIFSKQNAWRKDAPEFSFYDGPPFANGLPHYGHLLATTTKDTVPRYWIMRGYQVERRFGWDCHGLPVEFEIEKREGLKGRPDIERMGIAAFNEMCRESVMHYTQEWQKTIIRMGRWVDWNHQYRTMDRNFMESVWWVFSELYKKGLIYQGLKVVPYSPRTASVVSNFEANQNYQQLQDPAVTVKFALQGEEGHLLAWTTTPWTLPANLALAVHEKVEYVKVRDLESQEVWILATHALPRLYTKETQGYDILSTFLGKELVGKRYEPLFPYFHAHPKAFVVMHGDFVTTEDGTGVVHQAPAFGEDDFLTCQAHGISPVDPLDENGVFTEQAPDFKGLSFKEADKSICKFLKENHALVRHETLVHSYPFDERTNTPLMYRAVPSWYVSVEKLTDRLVANNQQVNWVPAHIREGRMGSWLKNARDWAISRNRFWGTPLPVWICAKDTSHLEVFGSISALEARANQNFPDIHLHSLQDVHFPCAHCTGRMEPVSFVFDCWFESGAMPYAQKHYPFENEAAFKKGFPADFIAEGLDQTRGWFYTLQVLACALFDQPAFRNVVVNGVILDENKKKMSKRHRNYIPPETLLGTYGADSVRLYMLNSPLLKADDLVFSDKEVKDIIRSMLLPLWNAYSFLATYATADGWKPTEEQVLGALPETDHTLDRWILSKVQTLLAEIEGHMDAYKLYAVVPSLGTFIENLTNWYIRLTRRRFWGASDQSGVSEEQHKAYSTLYYVLVTFSKALAPFAPFLSEHLYQNLTEGFEEKVPQSVHLCDFPSPNRENTDATLETQIQLMQAIVNLGRGLRQKHQLKTRQVLSALHIIAVDEAQAKLIKGIVGLVQTELNVKRVEISTDETEYVNLEVKPNLLVLGKKLGKELASLRQKLSQLNADQKELRLFLTQLRKDSTYSFLQHQLIESDFLIERRPKAEKAVASDGALTLLFDMDLSEELVSEGYAREIVSRIQNLRKESQLQVSDRIRLEILVPHKLAEAVEAHRDMIMEETLCVQLHLMRAHGECTYKYTQSYSIEGATCVLALEAVSSDR
jgi:isoleucyl-tRNA synthetase